MEAEYVALCEIGKMVIWIRNLLENIGVVLDEPTKIFEDNSACLELAKNPTHHERAKHSTYAIIIFVT